MVFKSFIQGWKKVYQFKKMWLFIFLINLLLALFLAFPMQSTLQDSFGDSLVEDNMRKGFDYWWYRQFRFEGKGLSNSFFGFIGGWGAVVENLNGLVTGAIFNQHYAVLGVCIIYLLLNIFFSGGILGLYNKAEAKFSLKEFFTQSGNYFWRFFRLFLISLPFYILIVYVLRFILSIFVFIITMNQLTEKPSFFLSLVVNLLALFLLCLINMIFEYAKISTVVQQGKSMFRQLGRAIKFVFKNFSKTLRLYYLIFATGIILILEYALIETNFEQAVIWSLLIVLLIQQIFMLGKIWIRLTFYAGQLELFKTVGATKKTKK